MSSQNTEGFEANEKLMSSHLHAQLQIHGEFPHKRAPKLDVGWFGNLNLGTLANP